ncbi:hypothetical protein T4E_897 [Trichinella pseudospiralis]|uniref:Uncharacterized protein n=1 Tax=Trichinella pseudospiralis TaxID=6337 RepID=A0A0V0XP09_TRIPS|nr:hypothetical protein T4E_897 [Trichinella pseudospiralis]
MQLFYCVEIIFGFRLFCNFCFFLFFTFHIYYCYEHFPKQILFILFLKIFFPF